MTGSVVSIIPLLSLVALIGAGCSHDPPAAELYHIGMTRQDVTARFGEPEAATTRPANGWPRRSGGSGGDDLGAFAGAFERECGVQVQTSEYYWVNRGFMAMGIYWDYLFFDADDRLLGFYRRFVD